MSDARSGASGTPIVDTTQFLRAAVSALKVEVPASLPPGHQIDPATAGTSNTVVQNADGSWTETQRNGFAREMIAYQLSRP